MDVPFSDFFMLTDFNGFLNMGALFLFSELDDCFRQLILQDRSKKMPPPFDKQNIEISLPNQVGYERIVMASAATFAKMLGQKNHQF